MAWGSIMALASFASLAAAFSIGFTAEWSRWMLLLQWGIRGVAIPGLLIHEINTGLLRPDSLHGPRVPRAIPAVAIVGTGLLMLTGEVRFLPQALPQILPRLATTTLAGSVVTAFASIAALYFIVGLALVRHGLRDVPELAPLRQRLLGMLLAFCGGVALTLWGIYETSSGSPLLGASAGFAGEALATIAIGVTFLHSLRWRTASPPPDPGR